MTTHRAFIIIKPDAVKARKVGSILRIFEKNGFEISRIDSMHLQMWQVMALYKEHIGKDFFQRHLQFMLSGRVVAVALNRTGNVIHDGSTDILVAKLCGDTDPQKADKRSIRYKYGSALPKNAIHFSDSQTLAILESCIVFNT